MKKGLNLIVTISLLVFIIAFTSAAIEDSLHLNIQTKTSGGSIVTGTFSFVFNFSTTSDCNNVVFSNTTTLTTDSRGIISYYIQNISLDYTDQYYLCYYRDGTLKSNSGLARVPYAFNSKFLQGAKKSAFAPFNTSWVGNFNIQGSLFINGIDALNGSSEDTIPIGTIIHYNGTICPQGFGELVPARGRYLMGLNISNGTLGGQVGIALDGPENRTVGLHTHIQNQHQHTRPDLPDNTAGSAWVGQGGTGENNQRLTGFTTATNQNTGSVAGTNAPYIQYLTCIKNATVDLTKGWSQDTSLYVTDQTLNVGIGTTSPTAKLEVNGSIKADNLTDLSGGLISIPSGFVGFYNLTACPTGWSEMVSAQGRYVVGISSSSTLGDTQGAALSDGENRTVGQHNHGVSESAHSHAQRVTANTGGPAIRRDYTSDGDGNIFSQGINTGTASTGITINNAGTAGGTNAPYIQLLVCVKD